MLRSVTDISGQPILTLKMGLMDCPEMLVTDYQFTLCNIPEEQRFYVTVYEIIVVL
jgi:hypothetical protein